MIIGLIAVLITLLLLFLWQDRYYKRWDIFTIKPSSLILQFILILGMAAMVSTIIIAIIHPDSAHLKTGLLSDLIVMITVTLPFLYLRIIKPLAEQQNLNIHTLTDNIPDSIIVLDKNGIITYCNPATETIYGYTPSELNGQHIMVLMDEKGIEDFHADIKNKQPSTPFSINRQIGGKRKDGSMLTAYLTANGIKLNNNFFIVGIIKDITDLQNVSDELKRTSAFLNAILENIPVAVFAKNADDHRFLFWNKYSEKFFGLKQEDVMNKNDYDFFPKEQADFFWQKDKETIEKGEVINIPEEPITLPDGSTLTLHTTKVPVTNEKNKTRFLLAISEDITEHKKADELKDKLLRIIKAVNAINLLITKETNAVSLLQRVCRILIDTRDYDIAAIRLKEPNFHNINSIVSAASENLNMDVSKSLTYMDKHILDYLDKGSTSIELNKNELFNAVCSIPMIDNGLLIGTLFICSHEDIKFDTDEVNMLQELASDITFALHHIEEMVKKERAEKELHTSNENFQRMFYLNPQASLITNMNGDILYSNETFRDMLGYSQEEIAGTNVSDLAIWYEPFNKEEVQKQIESEAYRKGSELKVKNKQNKLLHTLFSVQILEMNGQPHILIVIQDISKLKQTEQEIHNIADRLINAQKIARIGNWEWDIQKNLIMRGDEVLEMFNVTAEQVGATFEEFIAMIHPDDRVIVTQKINEAFAQGKDYSGVIEHRMLLPDGRLFYVSEQAKVYFDEAGKPLKVVGIIQDITEKAMMEENLRESEDRFRRVAGYAQDAIIIMDDEGKITYWNKAAERIFGYPKEEILNREMHKILAPTSYYEAYNKGVEHFKKTGEGPVIGKTLELSAIRKNGEEFPVELSISTIKVKNNWHAVGILRDITDRKLAEANNTRLAAIVESSNDAIISKDMEDRITSWNKGAETMYGYRANEVIGESIHILIPGEYRHDINEFMEKIKEGEDVTYYETKRKRKDGTLIDVSLTLSPIKDSNGTITGISTIARDITEQKKIEKELIRAKEAAEGANKAKTEFLTNMSHEIRTPMNAILGMADMLLETHPTDEQRQYINIFRKSGGQLINLINDILDLSKVEEGHMGLNIVDFDLSEMLNNIEMMVSIKSAEKGLSLNFDVDRQIPKYLRGDANKLNRIILNIVGNAVKFTEKGRVDVAVRLTKPDANEAELLFSIKDTGIGIAKDKLGYIFQRFSQVDSSITRQHGGTGLGLFISKRLLDMMGGTIRVDSEIGKGSTFYFTVKFGIAQKALQQNHEDVIITQQETEKKKYNILLVEDSEDNRQLIELYLKKLPYDVDIAENGAIAIEKTKQNNYDLILMDIQMPVMDGYAATQIIREREKRDRLPSIPIIALTANAFKEDEDKSYAAGCNAYLTKPIKKGLLVETMNKYLEKNHE